MNINPVSFGRIVKVNASIDVAKDIADIANRYNTKTDKNVTNKIKNIFYDSSKGEVVAFNPTQNDSISYLFSGEDSQKANDIWADMHDECDRACSYYHGEEDLVEAAFSSAGETAAKKLNELISSKKHVSLMNVIPSNDGEKIKFIDFNV